MSISVHAPEVKTTSYRHSLEQAPNMSRLLILTEEAFMDGKQIVAAFYEAVKEGDAVALEAVLGEKFELIVPAADGVLAGRYVGKDNFLSYIIPGVFSCVDPQEITFCSSHEIICAEGDRVVAIANNLGKAKTGRDYNQTYAHIFTIDDGKIQKLIEFFDTALANNALWGDSVPLKADQPFHMNQILND